MKDLKRERNKLIKQCEERKVKVDRKNMTVKQQVAAMGKVLK